MNASRIPGFPDVGRTIPAAALTAVTAVAGLLTSWVVVGQSGWLVVSILLVAAAAAFPRTPFAAMLIVQLGVAEILTGAHGYTGRFAILLAGAHLLLATGMLSAWLPRRARVQATMLRRPLLRYLGVQVASQIAAFVVLTGVAGGTGPGILWLGVVGAAAAVVLAVVVLAPVLLRPSRP